MLEKLNMVTLQLNQNETKKHREIKNSMLFFAKNKVKFEHFKVPKLY